MALFFLLGTSSDKRTLINVAIQLMRYELCFWFYIYLIEELDHTVLPYIVLLIIPILGCMSDQEVRVRKTITNCFATLIKLIPLEVCSKWLWVVTRLFFLSEFHFVPSKAKRLLACFYGRGRWGASFPLNTEWEAHKITRARKKNNQI